MLRWLLLPALCLLALAPAASGAVRRGLNVYPTGTADDRSLDMAQTAGADTVRFDISWASLQPHAPSGGVIGTDPDYVAYIDHAIDAASARGIAVIATLEQTPCWASSAPDDDRAPCVSGAHSSDYLRYAPGHASDYAAIAGWVAHRWGSRLAALEIWNEPNFTRFFAVNDPAAYSGDDSLWVSDPQAPGASGNQAVQAADEAHAYTQLLQAAYPAIKSQVPALPVLGGALAYSASGFLGRLYDDGIHGYFDALSIHPYDDRPLFARTGNHAVSFTYGVPDVHDVMSANGDGDRSLWLTEFGWPTCAPSVMDWCVSEDEQASRLTEAFQLANGWPYVAATIIYELHDAGTDPNDFNQNMGLVRNDWTPKPGWQAFIDAIAPSPAITAPPPPPTQQVVTSLPPSGTPVANAKKPRRHHPVAVSRVRRAGRHRIAITLQCRSSKSCRSRITIRHGRATLAHLTLTIHPHATRRLTVHVSRAVPHSLRAVSTAA